MSTRSLFEAAREDAPSTDARDAMWSRISVTTAQAAAVGVAVAAKPLATAAVKSVAPTAQAAGVLTPKLLVVGGIIGAFGTALGVAVTLLVVSPKVEPTSPSRAHAHASAHERAPGARLATPSARKLDTASLAPVSELDDPEVHDRPAPVADVAAPVDPASELAVEAKLVSDARAALVRGDAATALALVTRARRLTVRALEPEELGIESRALRALGRADEAAATELGLKRRFPESALAR